MREVGVSGSDETTTGRITFLILRGFFAQFWLLQFFGKLRDADAGTVSFGNLATWSARTTEWFVKTSPMPAFAVAPYTYAVPYIELALGLLILVGYKTRWALFAAAAYIVSLDVGLMFQLKHDVVGTNTVTMLTLILAAYLAKYEVFTVDAGFRWPREA
jgi:thiosulfate dehydrogenase [quinone] large subunit